MAHRGRGHGRPRRKENVEDVNDLIVVMRIMKARLDVIEVAQRSGITYVVKAKSDDDEELENIR